MASLESQSSWSLVILMFTFVLYLLEKNDFHPHDDVAHHIHDVTNETLWKVLLLKVLLMTVILHYLQERSLKFLIQIKKIVQCIHSLSLLYFLDMYKHQSQYDNIKWDCCASLRMKYLWLKTMKGFLLFVNFLLVGRSIRSSETLQIAYALSHIVMHFKKQNICMITHLKLKSPSKTRFLPTFTFHIKLKVHSQPCHLPM